MSEQEKEERRRKSFDYWLGNTFVTEVAPKDRQWFLDTLRKKYLALLLGMRHFYGVEAENKELKEQLKMERGLNAQLTEELQKYSQS